MSRLHAIELHLLMLTGIAFLCVSGWQVWRAGKTMDAVNGEIVSLGSTQAKLNGDLDEAHRLILEAGLTAMEARKASKLELAYLPEWNRQIAATMVNVNQTVTALQGTARAASETLHGASLDLSALNDSIAATKPLIEASTATVKHADKLISDPALPQTAANVQKLTFHAAGIADDTHQVTHHFEREIDSPKPKTLMQKVGVGWKIFWQAAMLAK